MEIKINKSLHQNKQITPNFSAKLTDPPILIHNKKTIYRSYYFLLLKNKTKSYPN